MRILKTYLFSYEAHLDLAKLRDERIEAVLRDDNIVSINPVYAQAVGGIKILVHDEDYDKAEEILKANSYEELKDEFQPEEVERQRKCSNCGSIDTIHKNSTFAGIFFYLLASIPVVKKTEKFKCMNCRYEWKE